MAKKIELKADFDDAVVTAGNSRVEFKTDGSIHVFTSGTVQVKPAPTNDNSITVVKSALEVGAKMADGSVFAGISPETNQPMYAAPADEPLRSTFNRAKERAEEKSRETGKAYRVPSENELKVLSNNRAAIGGFNLMGSDSAGWYWSSTPNYDDTARCQRLSDGNQNNVGRSLGLSVRLVRS